MNDNKFKLNRFYIAGAAALFALALLFAGNGGIINLQQNVSAQRETSIETRNAEAPEAPQACALTGTIGTAPIGGSTGFLTARLFKGGVASNCSSAPYPGTANGGPYAYNIHNITNTSSSPACVTFTLSSSLTDLQIAAFRQPFVAADIANPTRYLGDPGNSSGFVPAGILTFQTIIPANTSIAVVVFSPISSAGIGVPYALYITSTNDAVGTVCGTGTGTKSYTGAVVPIPDNTTAGVNVTLPVTGIGRIKDLNFNFPIGGNCNATVGNVTAAVDHTFVGDLTFKLTSPKGTAVTFMANRGGTRENICSTVLTDESNFPLISSITSMTGLSVQGEFQPEITGRFNLFRGENADGNWTLNVSDNALADTGNLRRFALNFTGNLFPTNDFDNDGKSDISISRTNGANREWWYLQSGNSVNKAFVFGIPTDRIIPGDYTGDGTADLGIWRPTSGEWFIFRTEDSTFYSFPFGANGDVPAPADYDGDGKFDAAVFRPSGATWFIAKSSGGTDIRGFGIPADAPVPADYDGDNKADLAVYRSNGANQEWWILKSTGGSFATVFGTTGDKAVPADYTGDGKVDIAVWRPSTGNWLILRSEDLSFFAFPFGATGDIPAPGDYDGDGKYDAAVFRPSTATWFLNRSTAGTQIVGFGSAADRPLASAYTP
jgi:subtilisin-like proprotein convertase family protein